MFLLTKKIKEIKGSERTILAFIIVSIPILYLFLVISTWKVYDTQYNYITSNVKNKVDLITKTGVIHPALDMHLKNNIEKILGDEYTLEYYTIDYDELEPALNLSNPSTDDYPLPKKIDSPINRKFKTGDMVYIQVKSNKEMLYSKLINAILPGESYGEAKMIVVEEGMVEVNAK